MSRLWFIRLNVRIGRPLEPGSVAGSILGPLLLFTQRILQYVTLHLYVTRVFLFTSNCILNFRRPFGCNLELTQPMENRSQHH